MEEIFVRKLTGSTGDCNDFVVSLLFKSDIVQLWIGVLQL